MFGWTAESLIKDPSSLQRCVHPLETGVFGTAQDKVLQGIYLPSCVCIRNNLEIDFVKVRWSLAQGLGAPSNRDGKAQPPVLRGQLRPRSTYIKPFTSTVIYTTSIWCAVAQLYTIYRLQHSLVTTCQYTLVA